MRQKIIPLLGCAALLLNGDGCKTSHRHAAMVKIVSHKNDARLQIRQEQGAAIIDIFSESGIGEAAFEFIPDSLPSKILLRFHLRGLEELRFAYGETVISAAISSTGQHEIRQSLSQAGERPMEALTTSSPFWMKLRVVSREPKIPLRDGYVEVEAPQDFLSSGARNATIHWIDFYR